MPWRKMVVNTHVSASYNTIKRPFAGLWGEESNTGVMNSGAGNNSPIGYLRIYRLQITVGQKRTMNRL
jgi:hypothetical protein